MAPETPWELEGEIPPAQEIPSPALAFVGALIAVAALAAGALALFM